MKSNHFGYLGESETAVAMQCPRCNQGMQILRNKVYERKEDEGIYFIEDEHSCICGFASEYIDKKFLGNSIAIHQERCKLILTMSAITFLVFIIGAFSMPEYGIPRFIPYLLFGCLGASIFGVILNRKEIKKINVLENKGNNILREKIKDEDGETIARLSKEIQSKIMEANIATDAKTIYHKTSSSELNNSENYFVWCIDNTLNFFPVVKADSLVNEIKQLNEDGSVDKLNIKKAYMKRLQRIVSEANKVVIEINRIEHYATRGEVFRETVITGGGGGGSSIKGAVVGGVIAGDAGAVIGSRKKVDPIKSELKTHDTRETYISYFTKDNERNNIILNFEDYQILKDLIPQKDYEIVSALHMNNTIQQSKENSNVQSITDQIREIAKLKEDGILTVQEFETKKQELLKKI